MDCQILFLKIALLILIPYDHLGIQAARRNKKFQNCPGLELENGRVKIRLQGRLAKFSCRKRFHMVGSSFTTCRDGEWGYPKPVCAAPGCPMPKSTSSMTAVVSQAGILMTYHCLVPTRTASKTVFCNGRVWSSGPPDCSGSENTHSSGEDSRETEEEQTNNIIEDKATTTKKLTTLTTKPTTTRTVKTTPLTTTRPTTLTTTKKTTLKTTPRTTTTLLPLTTLGRTKHKPVMTSTKKPIVTATSSTSSAPSTVTSSIKPIVTSMTTFEQSTMMPTEISLNPEFKPTEVSKSVNTQLNVPLPATAPHQMTSSEKEGNPQQVAPSKAEVHWSVSVGMVSGIVAAGICSLGVLAAVVCFVKRRRHVTTYNQSRDWEFVQPILVQLRSASETTTTSPC